MEEEVKAVEAPVASKRENDEETRVYEIGYHLVPTYSEDEALKEAGNLRGVIEKKGGVIIAEELPKEFELAYEMARDISNRKTRFNQSYFGWIKFELEPEEVAKMKIELNRDERIIRFLIIKTVRENTVVGKRLTMRGDVVRRKYVAKKDDEPAVEVDKAEVDKKLDELLSEE